MSTIVTKRCELCGEIKPISEFYTSNGKPRGRACKPCESGKNVKRYHENRKEYLPAMTKYRQQARIDAVTHYGGKCECCGESRLEFLAIDHINGGGNKHHKEIKGMAIGIWLRKHNYPAGFRVLCHNCNLSLGFFGYCPHNKPDNP